MSSRGTRSPRDVALGLLARREHARAELRAKLRGRGFSGNEIENALGALEADGWLSDNRYAESYARSRAESGYGPVRIGAELRQRGVDGACIRNALAEYGGEWERLALDYYRRRFGDSPPVNFEEGAKRMRHMQQRGFEMGTLRALPGQAGGRDADDD